MSIEGPGAPPSEPLSRRKRVRDAGPPARAEPASEASGAYRRIGRFYFHKRQVHARQQQRLQEISAFYDDEEVVRDLLAPIARQEYEISLRLLDYTMTNWAKKTTVMLSAPRFPGQERSTPWALFSLYKDWLRFYRRRGFDPFRRRERIFFDATSKDGVSERLQTTVAQLNFLRWAKIYGILDYVLLHKLQIEEDMVRTLAESKKRRLRTKSDVRREEQLELGRKTKREELSQAPGNKCMVCPVLQQIRFEVLDSKGALERSTQTELREGTSD